MRIVLTCAASLAATTDPVPPPAWAAAREALRKLGHDVELVELGASPSTFAHKLQAAAADLVLPLAPESGHAPHHVRLSLAVADCLGLPVAGASAEALARTSDAFAARARLGAVGARFGDAAPPGATRAFVAWLRAANSTAARGGAVALDQDRLAPLTLPAKVTTRLAEEMDRAASALTLGDWALFTFDLGAEDEVSLAAIDPLPDLEEGKPMVASLSAAGVSLEVALARVVAAARARHRIAEGPARAPKRAVRVGLAYNVKRIKPQLGGKQDDEAEFDSPSTIEALAKAIGSLGHEVVHLEATPELAGRLRPEDVDVVFNIAEGLRGRSREAQVPALLELLDVPYTGSDPATLSLALDKGLAKRVVKQAGVNTPAWTVMHTGKEKLPKDLSFPVVVKPVAEGSSKGVLAKSVVENEAELREAARTIAERYGDGALVEEFLPGREFTVGILGEQRLKVLPPMEIIFRADLRNPIYTFDHKQEMGDEVRYQVPAEVDPALAKQIDKVAVGAFRALGCRDVARIDVRVDARGRVSFIECNPLPGLSPGWSDLCLIAQAIGMSYESLIGEILAPAMRRYRTKLAASRRAENGTKGT